MTVLRSAATVSGLTLLSRISGLARDLLVARFFGAGATMDAFTVAFRLPNLLRRLFAEGAFAQAFVPIFAHVRAVDGEERVKVVFAHVVSALFWTLLAVSIAGVVAAPLLVMIIASGFLRRPEVFDLATLLTRYTFPYIFFMSLVACAAGALNTYRRFAVPAFTPVLLNLSFIACTFLLSGRMHPPITSLAVAVLLGGVAQLAFQLPALAGIGLLPRIGSFRAAFADPVVRRILRQMGPALFAVSVAQLSLIVNTAIASYLGPGSNSWLYYADRLMEFPTGLLGVALGTAILPTLSRAHAEGRKADYSRLLDWGLRTTLLLALPAAVGLGVLAPGLLSVMFLGGRFGAYDVGQTALALMGYSIGLIGLIGVKILAPGYYARQDIRTPVKIAIVSLCITQAANTVLVPWLRHAGLALSISLGALANAGTLAYLLRRAGVWQPASGWAGFCVRIVVATVFMAGVLHWISNGVEWTAPGQRLAHALSLALAIAAGAASYFAVMFAGGWRLRQLHPPAD